jgi:hypothetical protein
MHCKTCGSGNQTEFDAEINIHFPGLRNLDRPAVLVFPKLLVCPDLSGVMGSAKSNLAMQSALGNSFHSKKLHRSAFCSMVLFVWKQSQGVLGCGDCCCCFFAAACSASVIALRNSWTAVTLGGRRAFLALYDQMEALLDLKVSPPK